MAKQLLKVGVWLSRLGKVHGKNVCVNASEQIDCLVIRFGEIEKHKSTLDVYKEA